MAMEILLATVGYLRQFRCATGIKTFPQRIYSTPIYSLSSPVTSREWRQFPQTQIEGRNMLPKHYLLQLINNYCIGLCWPMMNYSFHGKTFSNLQQLAALRSKRNTPTFKLVSTSP
jgi:hypothetical protein